MSHEDRAKCFAQIVKERKSVRAFNGTPVDKTLIETVFTTAQQSPSNCNTQPWHIHVVSGKRCEKLRKQFPELMAKGELSMDFPFEGKYDGVYRDRQYAAALALYDALGIKREEKGRRAEAFAKNFSFFGAPHVAFVFMEDFCDVREAADVGMYAQTLMLAMQANGIACCPQTALSFFADAVREFLGIDEGHKLLFGISFGYEDETDPVNRARTERAKLCETTTFYD